MSSSSQQQHTSYKDHGNSTQKKRSLSTVVVSNNHNSNNNSDSIDTASDSRDHNDHDEEKLGVVHHNSKRVRTVGATTVEARRNEIGDQQPPPRDQTKTHPPTTVLGRAFEPNDSHHLFPFLFESHHNEYVPQRGTVTRTNPSLKISQNFSFVLPRLYTTDTQHTYFIYEQQQ